MKNYNVCTFAFRFIMVLLLKEFQYSSFVISLQKEAPISHFYSSQHE